LVASDILESVIGPTIVGLGYELWGIERQRTPRGLLVRVFIDHGDGIALADCERVSLQVRDLLAAETALTGDYLLEVSSPGLDRLLFKLEHYQKYLGAVVQVKLRIPQSGRRNFQGALIEVTDRAVQLKLEDESIVVPHGAIERMRLVPQWPDKRIASHGSPRRKQTG
jgi:ribosome maturation factor RimP